MNQQLRTVHAITLPPASKIRIRETPRGLTVAWTTRPEWSLARTFQAAFGGFWLAGWTVGECAATTVHEHFERWHVLESGSHLENMTGLAPGSHVD